jgi:vacuolar-type H+-ATPase subunit I/STV1
MTAAAGRVVGKIAAVRLLVAVLWAGALWVLGYIAAPAVFSIASGALAGDIVGAFLRRLAWISIACAVLMLVLVQVSPDLERGRRRYLNLLVLAMLACALVMFVGLQPAMASLREAAGPGGVRSSPLWTQFAVLHGISQLFHLIEAVLAAILVVKSR